MMPLPQRLLRLVLAVACLLLVPLVAMQFTQEVAWTLSDFVVASILLFGAGLAYMMVADKGRTTAYKLATGVAAAAALLLVWGNLAVGFIGRENNPANLLYGAVLVVGFIWSVVARFQQLGMARAMFAAALVQVLVPLVAALIWPLEVAAGMTRVLLLNTLFAGLWVAAALLFRRAAGAHTIHV